MVETLSKNITRQGLTATTLNYLRVSSSITSIEPVVSEGAGPPPTPPSSTTGSIELILLLTLR